MKMEDIKKQSDKDLASTVAEARKTVREERFKDKFSRKAGTIRTAKKDIARALTELSTRQSALTSPELRRSESPKLQRDELNKESK